MKRLAKRKTASELKAAKNSRAIQHGFSLVEVLVALLVLTVGLLGLAGLQSFGLRFSHESYERTQANVLVYDVLDRLRANPTVALAAANSYDGTIESTSAAPAAPTCAAACTGTDLRDYDRLRWYRLMVGDNSVAPPIRGLFTADNDTDLLIAHNAATGIFTVTISWKEKDLQMSHSVQTRLF